MIPKVIHYVWLSGEEMPVLNQVCIESWHRVLADYEIRCWRAADFDLNSVPYLHEAVKARMWAFATDYLRANILYREGGIYLDSDVYLSDNFDSYLGNRFFSCIEHHWDSKAPAIQAACMGAEARHPFMRDCAAHYAGRHFFGPDGKPDMTVLAPDLYARIAVGYGFDLTNCGPQLLHEGIRLYDSSMVAGTPWEIRPDSMAVHLCAGSWRDMSDVERLRFARMKLGLLLQALES